MSLSESDFVTTDINNDIDIPCCEVSDDKFVAYDHLDDDTICGIVRNYLIVVGDISEEVAKQEVDKYQSIEHTWAREVPGSFYRLLYHGEVVDNYTDVPVTVLYL